MTDMVDEDYRPISCERYAELELHIMRCRHLRVAWRDQMGAHIESLLPEDLRTRGGAEYLLARTRQGEQRTIRLDQLRHFTPL